MIFLKAVRQIFCLEAESQIAREEFLARKQGVWKNISNYMENKFALFKTAYEDNDDQTILLYSQSVYMAWLTQL